MSWGFWITLILMTAGFAKLSTAMLNRTLAMPQPRWFMTVTELLQLCLLPVYVWLLFQRFGGGRLEHLLMEFRWNAFNTLEVGLLGIGVVGLLALIRSSVAYQQYRPPACQLASESKLIDFRQTDDGSPWHETLVGPGPMRQIALLPGNEQFSLEVNTQLYALPRMHAEWDGLSIVHLSDLHFYGAVTRKYFVSVCEQAMAMEPDLFVFTGDLLDDQGLLEWLPETLGRLKAPLGQYFILGNHDWLLDPKPVRQEFERLGWTNLAGRSKTITSTSKSSAIEMAGNEAPWMGGPPEQTTSPTAALRILLSHTPDNIEWARRHQFDLMLAGHTHGGQIRLPILGPVYSPSRYGCRFASGAFWLEPTLMCVSRGISGREPIRYLCKPELTKLILRSAR